MYTEVGEQMAEQNILNGNQKKLEQIIGDVKEHNTKKVQQKIEAKQYGLRYMIL